MNYYKVFWRGADSRSGEYKIWATDRTRAIWDCIEKARSETGKPNEPVIVTEVLCLYDRHRKME